MIRRLFSFVLVSGLLMVPGCSRDVRVGTLAKPARVTAPVSEPVESSPIGVRLEPPPPPSAAVPTLLEAGEKDFQKRERALAAELAKMWTRDPERLVAVIDEASRCDQASPPVSLLLAIAHAETNGKILDVSEAGAVGLAQATPIAYRQEKSVGKLFVTPEYLTGARAYLAKKPLGDADTIATLLLTRDDPRNRKRARKLLKAAYDLRTEGFDELDLLEPYATKTFKQRVRYADRHSLAVLRELEPLVAHGNRKQLRVFRDRTRIEYRSLKATQVTAWKSYQDTLIELRDTMLSSHYGMPANRVRNERPYEAGEYLGENLDARFSSKAMATFLVRHLERKTSEARALAANGQDVDKLTASLYNGGSHNVKRMLAGLITSLPETQRYAIKVHNTMRRLNGCLGPIDTKVASAVTKRIEN
ncbi:MAG TPA: hypothetical protein VHL58_10390 [Thermoanaerobaculia bacterium]|nr:hypothetical protein [Thermoanaerobaculia bacterium]